MKNKLTIIALLLLFSLNINAQTFTTDKDSISVTAESSEFEVEAKIYITAGANDLTNLKWVKLESSQPSGWLDLGICDNNNCYTVIDSETFDTIKAATTDNIKVVFYPQDIEGIGYVKLLLYDGDGKRSEGKILEFYFSTLFASVLESENQLPSSAIFPNPAEDIINIDLSAVNQKVNYLELINTAGKTVYSVRPATGNDAVKINTHQFQKGMYLVIMHTDREVFKNKILIH